MVARGDYDHSQSDLAMIFGVMFEEGGEASQPVQDSFTVIEAVHGENQLVISEQFSRAVDRLTDFRLCRSIVVQVVINPHRKGIYSYDPIA